MSDSLEWLKMQNIPYFQGIHRSNLLLQQATALLIRYRDALLVDSLERPTSKEVNEFLERCK